MANVADLNLIQINNFPEVENPSEWIVVSDAAGTAYKISKENFKAFLGTVQVVAPKAIAPESSTPELDGVYKPTVDGTYANAGGLVVDRSEGGEDYGKSVTILKNGSQFVKVGEPLPEIELTSSIDASLVGTAVNSKAVVDYVAPIENRIDSLGEEFASFNPTVSELEGDTSNGQYGVGYIFNSRNLSFDILEGYILGSNANADLEINVYLLNSIPAASTVLTLPAPVLTQQFKAPPTAAPTIRLVLNKKIVSDGKFVFISFKNIATNNTVSVQRKTNKPVPVDGSDYAIGVVNTVEGAPDTDWLVNSYTYRFTGLKLFLSSNIITSDNLASKLPPSVAAIVDNLTDSRGFGIDVNSGTYGADNAVYEFITQNVGNGNAYLGVEFKLNEDINIGNTDKRLMSISKGDNFINIDIQYRAVSQYEAKQILIQSASNTAPEWDFLSKYPMPYYNSRIVVKGEINGVALDTGFALRNLREYKPIAGLDAFMLQYKPEVIRAGGKIYSNQTLYGANQDWYIEITGVQLRVYNSTKGVNKVFLFSTYPFVDQLFDAIIKETESGVLTDFVFKSLNTGGVSNSAATNHKDTLPSTSLLKCTLKLVDKYPFDGAGSSPSKIAFDAWPCVIPYAVDNSLHSIEFATKAGSVGLMVTFDGKPINDGSYGYLRNASNLLSDSTVKLGNETNGVQCTFKNLESYSNTLNGYDVSFHHYLWGFIASRKNPRVVGIMWHDVIPSNVVGRNTTWTDIPKWMRLPIETIVSRGDYKINLIKGIDFQEVTSVGNNRYTATLKTGEVIEGAGTIVGGAVTQITADTLVSGDWSTSAFTKEWEGLISRVGADLLHTTAFLDQVFTDLAAKGYKTVTYKQISEFMHGNIELPSLKCFAPQWDDYAIYMYSIQDIFKVLVKHGVTLSVAWDLAYHKNRTTGVVDESATNVLQNMMIRGQEAVIHNHWSYTTQFVKAILSDDAERAILECIEFAKSHYINEYIWDESANLSTPNSMKLMELCGIDLCISTQNSNTTRATNKMYVSRGSFNPNTAPSWNPIV